MEKPTITEIDSGDPGLIAALTDARLPTDDLRKPGRRFFAFRDGGGVIGYVGWEVSGSAALLRSLVVLPTRRRQGWGNAMIAWALSQLAECGATEVYLLTTNIQKLAAKAGFVPIDRNLAPEAIRNSQQFLSLCPSIATLMKRQAPSL